MPTDVALAFKQKTRAKAQSFKQALEFLIILSLWAPVGAVITALVFERTFDPAITLQLWLAAA